ncbi:MAG: hypothetical protein Q7S45_05150 [Candidatus Curtissbacteria bacterium]|nr:hypothetical protein [Candidatus Curtissbacteria bacterium]
MTITITIEGDGLSLKKETNLQKAGQIIAFLGLAENSSEAGTRLDLVPSTVLSSPLALSPAELVIESKAKTNAQKIAVLGSYLLEKDGRDDFLTKEVLLLLRKIGEEPHNFARDLRTAESSQYVYPIDTKKGKYGVGQKGKQAIQNKFSDKIRATARTKRTGGVRKATPPRTEVLSLSIVSSLEGYPDFHVLPSKADAILWVLAYADEQKIEELTPREVEALTDKLRNKIEQKAFSAHNKRNIKLSYVSQTGNRFKLQQKGSDHLKKLRTGDDSGEK